MDLLTHLPLALAVCGMALRIALFFPRRPRA